MKKVQSRWLLLILIVLFLYVGLCFYLIAGRFSSHSQETDGVQSISLPIKMYSIYSAKWSPDGTHIAIEGDRRLESPAYIGITEAFVYDLKTQQIQIISKNGDQFLVSHSGWSPDGTKIALSGEPIVIVDRVFDRDGIWIYDIPSSQLNYLTRGTTSTWSPAGDQLAVIYTQDSFKFVKIFNFDNREEKTIYNLGIDDGFNLDLDWSPKGDILAISVPGTGPGGYRLDRIYLLSTDGLSF